MKAVSKSRQSLGEDGAKNTFVINVFFLAAIEATKVAAVVAGTWIMTPRPKFFDLQTPTLFFCCCLDT